MTDITPKNPRDLPAELTKLIDAGYLDLQGKDYLQVAHRVLWFRFIHPGHSITTELVLNQDVSYVKATVGVLDDGEFITLATSHKRVHAIGEGRGAAAKYPLETAETGAIGRALALCGFGTLAGDLIEGDQIADAPQKLTNNDIKGKF